MVVRRETARLRAILERTLLLVSATTGGAAGAYACRGAGEGSGAEDASAVDVTAGPDSGGEAQADVLPGSSDADAGPTWAPGCAPTAPVEYDAGVDAPNCEYRITLPCGLPSFVTSLD